MSKPEEENKAESTPPIAEQQQQVECVDESQPNAAGEDEAAVPTDTEKDEAEEKEEPKSAPAATTSTTTATSTHTTTTTSSTTEQTNTSSNQQHSSYTSSTRQPVDRSTSASRSRREQQAQMRSEARSNVSNQSPERKAEGSAARRRATPEKTNSHNNTSPENRRSGSGGGSGGRGGSPSGAGSDRGNNTSASSPKKHIQQNTSHYDQRRECISLQNQVSNLQDAIRIRDKEHKQQLLEKDDKIEHVRSELQHRTVQYHTERDNHEAMRQTVNQLHSRLKQEEARRVDDITKDLELSDLRRSLADLKLQLARSSSPKKGGDDHDTSSGKPAATATAAYKTQREKVFEEREMKLKIQLEMQQMRNDELEAARETQEKAIQELQETLKRYQADSAIDDEPPELRKVRVMAHLNADKIHRVASPQTAPVQQPQQLVASIVPGLRYRRETPPKRNAAGVTTPRTTSGVENLSYQRKISGEPTHYTRRPTPTGTQKTSASPSSPRRVGTAAGGNNGGEGTATTTTTTVTKRPASASSAVVNRNLSAQRETTFARNTSSSASRAAATSITVNTTAPPSPKAITRASPSRVKQFVQQSSFARMTTNQEARERQTMKPGIGGVPQPITRSANLLGGNGSTSRRNPSPGMRQLPAVDIQPTVVRQTNVSAVKSDQAYMTGGKFPTTFRPTRLVRHGAWEKPVSGTNGF